MSTALKITVPMFLVGIGLITGCETTPDSTGTRHSGSTGYITEIQQRTVSGGFTIDHPKWKEIGYRWDWTGFPGLDKGEQVSFCDAYNDIVVVQGDKASIAVMDAL